MADEGITVVLTTHLLEEADKADRVAIMFEGQVIADGTPQSLRSEMGDGLITISSSDLDGIEKILRDEMGLDTQRASNQVRIRCEAAPTWVPKIADRLGGSIHSISVGRPGLEDVFIAKTGYHFD
jgi:ABC-2 type transport system ATP-binding protein